LHRYTRRALASAGLPPVVITWIIFIVSNEINGAMANLASAMTEFASDPSTFEPELSQVFLIVTAVVLNFQALLPYTIDTPEFWLTLALVKLFPIAVDTIPWKDIRSAMRQPGTYPSLFFRNFPWEGTRYCCVVMQASEVMCAAFLMAPLVTIRRYSGVGWQGNPFGWIRCNDEPVDELLARFTVILVLSSAANAAHFALVGHASERMSREMAKHEPGTPHILPWPDGKLRSSSDILKGLGWRLTLVITACLPFVCLFALRMELTPTRCANFPPILSASKFFTDLFGLGS